MATTTTRPTAAMQQAAIAALEAALKACLPIVDSLAVGTTDRKSVTLIVANVGTALAVVENLEVQ